MNKHKIDNAVFFLFTMFLSSPYWFQLIERLGLDSLLVERDQISRGISGSIMGEWYLKTVHQIVRIKKERRLNGE